MEKLSSEQSETSDRVLEFDLSAELRHGIAVSNLAYALSKELGLPHEQCYDLAIAGMLHDIGKLKLRSYINGQESNPMVIEELKYVRMHSTLGYEELKDQGYSDFVLESILYHHENYDGTGYPLGKSGEHIPLYARIIRLVEQYDDMVSLHRGRENLSPSDAMEYLMAGSGTLFDPKLVELFVEKIAVYPVGCEVELSNGMHGVVAKNFERFFLRPVVKVVETGEMLNLRDDPDTRSIIITKMVIH